MKEYEVEIKLIGYIIVNANNKKEAYKEIEKLLQKKLTR